MSLTTYAGLSTAVFRRLNRAADSAVFDDMLQLVETDIFERLALKPVRPMHTVVASTLSAEYAATPTDILDAEALTIAYGGDTFTVLATTPQNIVAMIADDDTTGRPRYYAQVGTQFRFYPAPDASYALTLTYWAKPPALTSVATTNWLSLAHPAVYFHGLLAHLSQEYFDEKSAETHAALFDAALDKVLAAYPRRPDRSPLKSERDIVGSRPFNITTG